MQPHKQKLSTKCILCHVFLIDADNSIIISNYLHISWIAFLAWRDLSYPSNSTQDLNHDISIDASHSHSWFLSVIIIPFSLTIIPVDSHKIAFKSHWIRWTPESHSILKSHEDLLQFPLTFNIPLKSVKSPDISGKSWWNGPERPAWTRRTAPAPTTPWRRQRITLVQSKNSRIVNRRSGISQNSKTIIIESVNSNSDRKRQYIYIYTYIYIDCCWSKDLLPSWWLVAFSPCRRAKDQSLDTGETNIAMENSILIPGTLWSFNIAIENQWSIFIVDWPVKNMVISLISI